MGNDNVFTATCYTPRKEETDSTPFITATGAFVKPLFIAVDPRIIPLGSWVYIEEFDSFVQAYDTGSAIKGKRIDITVGSLAFARQWGKRPVHLYWAERKADVMAQVAKAKW